MSDERCMEEALRTETETARRCRRRCRPERIPAEDLRTILRENRIPIPEEPSVCDPARWREHRREIERLAARAIVEYDMKHRREMRRLAAWAKGVYEYDEYDKSKITLDLIERFFAGQSPESRR